MKKTMKIIVMALLCLNFSARSQAIPLKIGDQVPQNFWQQEYSIYKSGKIVKQNLSVYKGKPLILDFWATWCSSCIMGFPKLEALETEFNDKISVLAVSYEDKEKVKSFFTSNAGQRYKINTVVNDKFLSKLFPHRLVPHYVWLDGDGQIKAITSASEVSSQNISLLLNGEQLLTSSKKDIDLKLPLFSAGGFQEKQLLTYSILLKGEVQGTGSANQFRKTNGIIHGRVITNSSAFSLYRTVCASLYPSLKSKQILGTVKDTAALKGIGAENKWSYDLILPLEQSSDLYHQMLKDLNRFTGYAGRLMRNEQPCLILKCIGKNNKLISKGGETINKLHVTGPKYLQNGLISDLITRLNDDSEDNPLVFVLDETGIVEPINISFRTSFNNLQALNMELKDYGLELQEARRMIDVFLITDLNNK